ncbi:hypothetical protein E1B28_013160 [Marasmius oreades]|uniref:Uncharacterized protein n=1 Tax=Marasmius oreades TaxID=181124 RepID=A0A9P7RP08_9AGAR|nr:uncharacterized protein E1B28_013160 [Marasmius oreades]KAG7087179.1 hypothetical protein E1B28_013160 [Marasmius oreades]
MEKTNETSQQLTLAERQKLALQVEEERILTFLKDPFIDPLKLGPNRAVCKPCGRRVGLSKGRFRLKNWKRHKEECLMANFVKDEIDKGMEWTGNGFPPDPRSEEDIAVDLSEMFAGRGLFSAQMLPAFRELGFGCGGAPCRSPKEPHEPRSRQPSQTGAPTASSSQVAFKIIGRSGRREQMTHPRSRPSPLPSFPPLQRAPKRDFDELTRRRSKTPLQFNFNEQGQNMEDTQSLNVRVGRPPLIRFQSFSSFKTRISEIGRKFSGSLVGSRDIGWSNNATSATAQRSRSDISKSFILWRNDLFGKQTTGLEGSKAVQRSEAKLTRMGTI